MMSTTRNVIVNAEFNKNIKTYLFIYWGFLLLISIIGIPIFIFWLFGLGQNICDRYYKNLQCTLTDRHLEFRKGNMFKVEKTIPLENIQDLTFIQNPLLNLFGLRMLKIETAGQSTPNKGSDMQLIGIVEPIAFKEKVMEQRDLLKMKGENISAIRHSDTNKEELIDLLRDIKALLSDIRNKNNEANYR